MKDFFLKATSKYKYASIEGRIFYILASVGGAFALINTFINIVLDLGVISVLVAFTTSLFALFLLYSSQKRQDYMYPSYLGIIIITFVILPLLWFSNSGISGPTPYFFIFNSVLIAILLNKTKTKLMFVLQLFVLASLILTERLVPSLVSDYKSELSRVIDLGISFTLICIVTLIILKKIMIEYHNKITELRNVHGQLRILSITDELSGVYNRRFVMSKLKDNIININENSHLSVIMFDIDNFKAINDKYGHSMGDEVIRVVSRILKNNIRENDIIGRIGGEEFLIILEGSDLKKAKNKANSLRELIANLEWPERKLQVTISGGVYSKLETDSIDEVLDKVDICLYKAKNDGRNKVVCG